MKTEFKHNFEANYLSDRAFDGRRKTQFDPMETQF
jgi:hypothetical protein